MADLSKSFDPAAIAAASDAASSALAAASDAASKATAGLSKASDASSASIVAYSKASDASSAAAAPKNLYAKNATQQIISSSTTETTIFSATITGNTLGSTGAMKCRIAAEILNNNNSADYVTINIKYGATTLYSDSTKAITKSTNLIPVWIEFMLANQNATNAQVLNGLMVVGGQDAAATGVGSLNSDETVGTSPLCGTSAIDSTANQTLLVTVTLTSADTDLTWTTNWCALEKWI